ncbi:MAG: AAA family ATPase [Nanoarchaeota archaeon]
MELHTYKRSVEEIIKRITDLTFSKDKIVILIGGCARSGKTTLANELAAELNNKQISSQIINLDGWLISKDQRPLNSKVYERFDYTEIVNSLRLYLQGKGIKVYKYDIKSCSRIGEEELPSFTGKVVIIEGVIALDIPWLRERADITIFKDINDDIRKQRLKEYFKNRSMDETEKIKTIEERELEEVPYIKATKEYAQYILK